METITEPKQGWKTWFAEKLDRTEIKTQMMRGDREKIQKRFTQFLADITKLKTRIENATLKKNSYNNQIADLSSTPELSSKFTKLEQLKNEIKESKNHLDILLESMAFEMSQMFDFPDFNKLELCSNSSVTVGIKNELDWEFDGTYKIPEECFVSKEAELKKTINPWVKSQLSLGKIELPGIQIKQRLKVKATFKKKRIRG